MADHVQEAKLKRSAEGIRPVGEGWFVVQVSDLPALQEAFLVLSGECIPPPGLAHR
jgi:hypothetical protein